MERLSQVGWSLSGDKSAGIVEYVMVDTNFPSALYPHQLAAWHIQLLSFGCGFIYASVLIGNALCILLGSDIAGKSVAKSVSM
jgi:hypothetical protein